ncbi:MAG TPA: SDR family NAD-dependent epimerase/dehydratase, partial [Allosphingosinicella sp.]|nr:SDR family NAD-dependent epimerase/dehydratase [Allosphingosinicella sp.]
GNPAEIAMIDLARKVIALTGSDSELAFESLPEDDPLRRQPDIALAEAKLGWSPKIGLDEGLVQTIDYFRQA